MPQICMFAICAPPFVCGGGQQAFTLARKLAEKGNHITFCTINLDGSAPAEEQYPNLQIQRHRFWRPAYIQALFFAFWAAYFLVKNRKQIDIVHYPTGAFWYFVPSAWIARLLGIPTILKLTAMNVDDPISITKRRFGKSLLNALKLIDRTITTTVEFEQSYLSAGLPKSGYQLIPNGVDTDHFKPVKIKANQIKEKLNIPIEADIVLMVGHIMLGKGVDLLLEAWQIIHNAHPNAYLLLVGEETTDQLANGRSFPEEVKHLQQQGYRIHLIPYQHDILPFYQTADLFVLPSRSEGLPNATLEAMSVNLSVILSDIGGHREIDSQGTEVVFISLDSVSSLSQALHEQLVHLQEKTLVRNNRQLILDRFSLTAVADQYSQLYSQLTQQQ